MMTRGKIHNNVQLNKPIQRSSLSTLSQ